MLELRKDYILDRWVIIASVRGKRPYDFKQKRKIIKPKICFFCPGKESLTPPEIGRIEKDGKWIIRWFPNKFPFVEQKGSPQLNKMNKYFTSAASYGKHEVVVDTREHNKQLWDKSTKHIKLLLEVIKERIDVLKRLKDIKYVVVFKNHGEKAGTSIFHSHMQIAAISTFPPHLIEEISALKKHKSCPYCGIIKAESKGKRKCFENKTMAAFTPYASRFNYEIWIYPKRHIKSLNGLKNCEMDDLADLLQKSLLKLKEVNLAYNLVMHHSPKNQNIHFHIKIEPRKATWAGFELSSGIIINSVVPEEAAEFYRNK